MILNVDICAGMHVQSEMVASALIQTSDLSDTGQTL